MRKGILTRLPYAWGEGWANHFQRFFRDFWAGIGGRRGGQRAAPRAVRGTSAKRGLWTASAAGDFGCSRVSVRLGSRAARGAGECSARRLRPTRRRDRSDRRRRSLPYLQARAHQRRIEFRPFRAARLWPCPFRPAARLASPVCPCGSAPVEVSWKSRAARRGGIRRTVAIRRRMWAAKKMEPDSGSSPNSL